jgi:hypothetical protein
MKHTPGRLGLTLFLTALSLAPTCAHAESSTAAALAPEVKADLEQFDQRAGDLLVELLYRRNGTEMSALVMLCERYENDGKFRGFPAWARDGAKNLCSYADTMEALLVKNKAPLTQGHCKKLAKAISAFESAAQSPEYQETQTQSDRLLSAMKRAKKTTFGHSWNEGWFCPCSYDYACD